jgi:hypothetical protein
MKRRREERCTKGVAGDKDAWYIPWYISGYIPYGIYQLLHGIYHPKVLYTMGQPSRCQLSASTWTGDLRRRVPATCDIWLGPGLELAPSGPTRWQRWLRSGPMTAVGPGNICGRKLKLERLRNNLNVRRRSSVTEPRYQHRRRPRSIITSVDSVT